MGKEEDWKRRREREEERDREEEAETAAREAESNAGGKKAVVMNASTEKLVDLMARAEMIIDQLNNLYNQYVLGVDPRPPLERRKQLDQTMETLLLMSKPTASYQFRFSTLNARYSTHKERWDKQMKDLESGKIKRVAGPKRAA